MDEVIYFLSIDCEKQFCKPFFQKPFPSFGFDTASALRKCLPFT